MTKSLLEVRDLSMHFPLGMGKKLHALDELDLTLGEGRIVAVVGESGSGKSTLLRCIARVHEPSGGTIRVRGEDVGRLRGRALRKYRSAVQVVFQDPFGAINPAHPIRYQLDRAISLHTGLRGQARLQRRRELLESVGLRPAESFEDRYPHELSGGQRQRVCIATAVAGAPSVLLADEPVSMLDVSLRAGVLGLLDELRRKSNVALLLVTHDLASAGTLADETLVLYAGQSVEQAPTSVLLSTPRHPYTQLLVSATPDPRAQPRRIDTRGEVPTVIDPSPGCRFAPRCPLAAARCREATPPMSAIGPQHSARCHALAPDGTVRPDWNPQPTTEKELADAHN